MNLRDEIRNILMEYTEVKFSSSDVTDEILALIQPKFDEIKEHADNALNDGPPPFSGQSDVGHMRDRLREITTLCILEEPEPDEPADEGEKVDYQKLSTRLHDFTRHWLIKHSYHLKQIGSVHYCGDCETPDQSDAWVLIGWDNSSNTVYLQSVKDGTIKTQGGNSFVTRYGCVGDYPPEMCDEPEPIKVQVGQRWTTDAGETFIIADAKVSNYERVVFWEQSHVIGHMKSDKEIIEQYVLIEEPTK